MCHRDRQHFVCKFLPTTYWFSIFFILPVKCKSLIEIFQRTISHVACFMRSHSYQNLKSRKNIPILLFCYILLHLIKRFFRSMQRLLQFNLNNRKPINKESNVKTAILFTIDYLRTTNLIYHLINSISSANLILIKYC